MCLCLSVSLCLLPPCACPTQVDICPPDVLSHTRHVLAKSLKAMGKMPMFITSFEQVVGTAMLGLYSSRIVPVFAISSVTGGTPLGHLKEFLRLLPPKPKQKPKPPVVSQAAIRHEKHQKKQQKKMKKNGSGQAEEKLAKVQEGASSAALPDGTGSVLTLFSIDSFFLGVPGVQVNESVT